MRKLSLLLLVAVLMAGAIYAVQAYSGNGSDAAIGAKATAAVQSGGGVADQVAQCPKNADCPRDCERCPGDCKGCPGKCTDCPNYTDKDKDGRCDQREACHSADARQGCSGHARGSCGRHN